MKLNELKNKTIKNPSLASWMFQTREEIEKWISDGAFHGMTINPDLTISVEGTLVLSSAKLVSAVGRNGKLIPVQFKEIIDGGFVVRHVRLLSLIGSPQRVEGYVIVHTNRLITLKGGPRIVFGSFNCSTNQLRSLDHSPEYVDNDFLCHENNIETLHDIHKKIKTIGGRLSIGVNVKSNILGILKIKGVKEVDVNGPAAPGSPIYRARDIINQHLHTGDIHLAQEEMLEAGLGEFAKL